RVRLTRGFSRLEARDIVVSWLHEKPGPDEGRDNAEGNSQSRKAEPRDVRRRVLPPAPGHGCEMPGVVAELDSPGDRVVKEQAGVSKKDVAGFRQRTPGDGDVQGLLRRVDVAIRKEAVELDDGGNAAPETAFG